MNLYYKAFMFMTENEGGESDHKRDRGGKTLCGVSSRWHPIVYLKLKNANIEERHSILYKFYYDNYWNPIYLEIKDKRLAIRLFDLGVNLGKKKAIKLLQEILSVKVDGRFGQNTLRATNNQDVYDRYISRIEKYYRSLKDFDVFGKGWLNRLYRPIL